MFVASTAQAAQVAQESDGTTYGPVAGGIAGALAFLFTVWRAFHDRRPRIKVLTQVHRDEETYAVSVTVTNVGQTVESVREIGLAVATDPELRPADEQRVERGRTDELSVGVAEIARAVGKLNKGAALSQYFMHRPSRRAWTMAPGDLAEAEFDLVEHEDPAPNMWEPAWTSKPGGPYVDANKDRGTGEWGLVDLAAKSAWDRDAGLTRRR
ncbi:MAG: hypothetical protein J7513_02135 [Solirubrobacteraceae bacterium]|nr:hypothetical protein [Solirubrobacteraceae bacterium]